MTQRKPYNNLKITEEDMLDIFSANIHYLRKLPRWNLSQKTLATVLIRNEHLKTWGKDLNTVFSDARKNTPRVFPAELTPMSDFLQNAFPNSNEFIDPDRDCVMKSELFILSNAIRQHGAICTLYDDIMNQIGKTLQDDFFVIPSSVHEVLLLKASDTDCMELNEIIREVNETTVIPEEILSDHAYFYSRDRKELLCA